MAAATTNLRRSIVGATMLGAGLAQVLMLGPSSMPAIIMDLMCIGVFYAHKEQVRDLISKLKS
mgnify:CR=1 FL=1